LVLSGQVGRAALGDWAVTGSYFEACNCEAVCPCRMQDGRPGGQSTYGECAFVLSWAITEGFAGTLDLAGARVAMAGRYFDDETVARRHPLGSWDVVLYLDDRVSTRAAEALEAIFLGRTGAASSAGFTAAIGLVHAVRRAQIELDHSERRPFVRIAQRAMAQGRRPVDSDARISCGISGHDHPGTEWVADRLAVSDAGLSWQFAGRCGFASVFSYRSG
jgi:hypothetical protein